MNATEMEEDAMFPPFFPLLSHLLCLKQLWDNPPMVRIENSRTPSDSVDAFHPNEDLEQYDGC
jgi:hypothetical protein